MAEISLGEEFGRGDQNKIYYLLFTIACFGLMFFMYIGAKTAIDKYMLGFFLAIGVILGLGPFVIDMLINGNKDLPLDTIGFEDNSQIKSLNNFWSNIIYSLILGVLVVLYIRNTTQGIILAPEFTSFGSKISNALVSGLTAGVAESLVFFGFLFPTIYAFAARSKFGSGLSMVIATILASTIFMSYHYWVYQYQVTALLTVFIFGISQCILAYVFRSMFPLYFTHFANNFIVTLINSGAYMVVIHL